MVKHTLLILLSILILSCKKQQKENTTKPLSTSPHQAVKVSKSKNKTSYKVFNLSQIQGGWTSFSYYLEHEQSPKDQYKNKYYKLIYNDSCLDIIIDGYSLQKVNYKAYKIGFANEKNLENTNLESKGFFLVKKNNSVYPKNIQVKNDVQITDNLYLDYDVYNLFSDNLDYNNFNISEKVQFRKVNSLPIEVFEKLKKVISISKDKYLTNFSIKKASSKVTINVDKCYFYEDESLEVKKRAFLIKGDQAYLEQINDKSVKVYFDGKVIASGYLNKSEVTLPN